MGQGVRAGDLPSLAGARTGVPAVAPGTGGNDFDLGAVQLVAVGSDLWVANMVAQHGMRAARSGPPIRYEAVERCLQVLADHTDRLRASVHMPRIGCGLAGGKWELIEPIIARTLCERGIVTTVYDYD